jgi:hypothetical protein
MLRAVRELVDVLKDRERFGDLARFFAAKSSHLHAEEEGDPDFGRHLKAGLDLLIEENLDLVFDLTESPIETIFVNSLLLAFIKSNPLSLVVQHSVRTAPRQIEDFRQRREQFKKFTAWYKDKHGSLLGIDEFLDQELERGKMEAGEHRYLRRHVVYYEYLALENRFHLILQPGLPDIRVEGRSVRPDMLVWIPSDESVKVIVECDGFQHHSDKVAFIRDRKRDRALKAEGYQVLRYSGSEIYADPVAASVDLADHLWSMRP